MFFLTEFKIGKGSLRKYNVICKPFSYVCGIFESPKKPLKHETNQKL